MHDGGYVYAYSHISRDQASAVQHFWEFTRLYMTHRGIDPKGTRLLRRLTDALVLRDTCAPTTHSTSSTAARLHHRAAGPLRRLPARAPWWTAAPAREAP